jgi:hypothetical protein
MDLPKPQKEHDWLQQLVGTWDYEHIASCGPDQPDHTTRGVERVKSLGGLWVLCEGDGEMPDGGRMQMLITLGYDTDKKKFVGSFIANVMTMMWLYEGSLDAAGKVLTLDAEGPNMMDPGKTAKYQDITEMVNPDLRQFRSQVLTPDGKWHQFMRATYKRRR